MRTGNWGGECVRQVMRERVRAYVPLVSYSCDQIGIRKGRVRSYSIIKHSDRRVHLRKERTKIGGGGRHTTKKLSDTLHLTVTHTTVDRVGSQ